MKYDILHRTCFNYASPARDSFNDIRLEPPSIPEQKVESYSLVVKPEVRMNRYTDFYSNLVHHFEIPSAHTFLLIESRAKVETHWPEPIPDTELLCPMDKLSEKLDADRCFDFLQSSQFVELDVSAWRLALDAIEDRTDVWPVALALMRFTHEYLKYEPNSTHVHTHMREVIAQRRGVCQDYAHLFIGLSRSVKIPARYVSGYLATEIARATHAWVEIHIPNHGWRALDPTHNRQIDQTYVKIGHGRDYADVPPVSGNYHGTLERTMEVDVQIKSVMESAEQSQIQSQSQSQ